MCYAMAAYSSPDDFREYHEITGENCDYQLMREEIGDACFGGYSDFTILDLAGSSSNEGGSSWLSDFFSGVGDFGSDSGSDSGTDSGSDSGGDSGGGD